MSIKSKLCDLMGYEAAVPFGRARDALAAWCKITQEKIKIPTNCCPALLPFASELVPISAETGLAPVPVQLYGYRQEFPGSKIEIDPLMTGLFGKPFADSSIISFGYAKTIDIGGGGAILTQDKSLAAELEKFAFFPIILAEPLYDALDDIHSIIMEKKRRYEEIESKVADIFIRLPDRPTIPWRFTARCKCERDLIIHHQREFKAGKNYPALPGVTNPDAIKWSKEVINLW